MKYVLFLILTVFTFKVSAQIKTKDLRSLIGNWKGNLTYTDYSSGKPVKILADIAVSEISRHSFIFAYQYPKEPHANSSDTINIGAKGKMLNDKRVLSRTIYNKTVKLVTEKQGSDNNKPAALRYTYMIGKSNFVIRKEVRYVTDTEYFLRNEYNFSR